MDQENIPYYFIFWHTLLSRPGSGLQPFDETGSGKAGFRKNMKQPLEKTEPILKVIVLVKN